MFTPSNLLSATLFPAISPLQFFYINSHTQTSAPITNQSGGCCGMYFPKPFSLLHVKTLQQLQAQGHKTNTRQTVFISEASIKDTLYVNLSRAPILRKNHFRYREGALSKCLTRLQSVNIEKSYYCLTCLYLPKVPFTICRPYRVLGR